MPKKRSVIAMSANYLLLKENKQEMNTSMNQTILKEDANTSSNRSTFETMELSFTVFIILTLIFLSITVFFKLIGKLLDYLRKKLHTYCSKTSTACDKAKENNSSSSNNIQGDLESSKDFQ